MDMNKFEDTLCSIFGEENIKPYNKGFRVIVHYENVPYCIVLRNQEGRFVMDRDAVDEDESNYDEAYKNAYKLLIQNKGQLDGLIDV